MADPIKPSSQQLFHSRRPFAPVDQATQISQLRQLISSLNAVLIARTDALASKTSGFNGFNADGSESVKKG